MSDVKRKTRSIARIVGTDTPVAIRIRYIGTGSAESVTVTTATKIALKETGVDAVDYAFATYKTVGALVDAINASGLWEAKVLDSLRSYATASQFVTGAIDVGSVREGHISQSVYDVLVDTSAALYFAVRLSATRAFDKEELKKHAQVTLRGIKYAVNMGTAAADSVQVYEVDGTAEEKKLTYTSVDTTETEIDFASGWSGYSAEDGNDLVVIIKDAAALADATGNYLQAVGEVSY